MVGIETIVPDKAGSLLSGIILAYGFLSDVIAMAGHQNDVCKNVAVRGMYAVFMQVVTENLFLKRIKRLIYKRIILSFLVDVLH